MDRPAYDALAGLETLAGLQSELEGIYWVRAPRVQDFVMGLEGLRAAGGELAGGELRSPELLLVREDPGEVLLGLYVEEDVLGAATRGRLSSLACAAEGVSHFVYLATRAAAGRPVSLLELEAQAEVDKFVLLLLRLWRRGHRRSSPALRTRLFERVAYRDGTDGEQLDRYRTANSLGSGYARWLEERFVEGADLDGLLRELRSSYRLGAGEKLGYLGSRTLA
jgi:hypothetical protein